ncbi:hypothetical protein CAPTEDRAFT_228376 [Capitella teleta]|uniref:Peptidase S1 domain-containing protein n=1 Tax=Capitella teleta TaxID=283909 RepID=R7UVB7_CAPTE|nr:hypothetical protein CAPTEDRAFT_228376 [Capitella teleta]|eukprot:ELU10224.1 hypothetical protein CAPTEDRAFT_228376 [Capitella teleta]
MYACFDLSMAIPSTTYCDGIIDCPDGSDETPLCDCSDGFRCDVIECIDASSVCNGFEDCYDGTDEAEETCGRLPWHISFFGHHSLDVPANEVCTGFTCDDNSCLPIDWLCDGMSDCPGVEDEESCGELTSMQMFMLHMLDDVSDRCGDNFLCDSGSVCIAPTWICDKEADCDDGSDEAGCSYECVDGLHFTCVSDGECLPAIYQCDGEPDCVDGSDEIDCVAKFCDGQFSCGSPVDDCIDFSDVCNGVNDCGNNTKDEEETTCALIPCGNHGNDSSQHIHSYQKCDGIFDCKSRLDERNCGCDELLTHERYACENSEVCILKTWVCDDIEDCPNGDDERDCIKLELMCNDGFNSSFLPQQACDGINNCINRADEEHCGGFQCVREFACNDSTCLPLEKLCDGNFDCENDEEESLCELILCDESKSTIRSHQLCNGVYDCPGREDEMLCESHQCGGDALNETYLAFQKGDGYSDCSNGRDEALSSCNQESLLVDILQCGDLNICFAPEFWCDGYADCPLGEDESCKKIDGCSGYKCPNGSCIPNQHVCDGVVDCEDGSDETNATCDCDIVGFFRTEYKRCLDESCVLLKLWCDGTLPCGDETDDLTCDVLSCGDAANTTYLAYKHCDGLFDCPEKQDEILCDCNATVTFPDNEYKNCMDGSCVLAEFWCDGFNHCPNALDELECSCYYSDYNMTKCSDGRCIMDDWWCDGHFDCPDEDDEDDCIDDCQGSFTCENRKQCIPMDNLCDGQADCADASDEAQCAIQNYIAMLCFSRSFCSSGKVLTLTCQPNGCGEKAVRMSVVNTTKSFDTTLDGHLAWPWQAQIMRDGKYVCTGALIDTKWIITAATCVYNTSDISSLIVALGTTINQGRKVTSDAVTRDVLSIFVHDEHPESSIPSGIALLQIQDADFKIDVVHPVCIASYSEYFNSHHTCFVTGWGAETHTGHHQSVQLLQARVQLLQGEECVNKLSKGLDEPTVQVLKDEFAFQCIGNHHSHASACVGDIGSPLVCRRPGQTKWALVGVTTWLPETCHGAIPLAKVQSFEEWMMTVLQLSNL